MNRSRSATSIIWSTVVSAAAMLGTPACHHDAAKPTTPAPVEQAPVAGATPVEQAAPPADPEPVAVAEPTPAPPPAPETVKLELISTPVGAEVYRDGELLGTTPLALEVVKSEDATTLDVKLDGYKDKSVTLKPSADQHLEFSLVKAKRPRGSGGKGTGRGFILG